MRMPDFAGQRQVLRVPLAFLSHNGLIALVPDDSPDTYRLPYEDFACWPTTNLKDVHQIPAVVSKSIFFGGRKTPIDRESTKHFNLATVTGKDEEVRTLVLPMGASVLGDTTDRYLKSATSPSGISAGTRWVDLNDAAGLTAENYTMDLDVSDALIISVLTKCLMIRPD
jgi:hypothetical protein